ncbi:MAG TPA: PIG-L family deacetylase [Sedimentisphaerales bacterium]|nr:PIG-L family deacetylase [Sedimentisphaerales bacterium]
MLNRRAVRYDEDGLRHSAIVFSPHFDDETLGCGGTILRKKKAGAPVTIVFMTDGSKSHTHLISEEQSRTMRRQEGRAAGRALGLREDDILLLDFEETKLEEHWEAACSRVREILIDQRPDDVFIPYRKEPLLWSADHRATNRIVVSALRAIGRKTRVYEYPIWFWCHWPWVRFPLRRRREIIRHWIDHGPLRSVDLLRDFRCAIPVKEVVECKRAVLAEHKSQMTRLLPDVQWRTLRDVADGEFLACFFQDCEVFHTYLLPHGSRDSEHV